MKRTTVALLTLGLASLASAKAADFPAPAAAPAAMFSWSGLYIGGNAGQAQGRFDAEAPRLVGGLPFAIDAPAAFVGGGGVGLSRQFGALVLGVEGDFQNIRVGGEHTDPNFGYTQASTRWLATARARAGIVPDPYFLLYATGGAAVATVDIDTFVPGALIGSMTPVAALHSGTTNAGWILGAGAEAALTSFLSLKLEYLYTDLSMSSRRAASLAPAALGPGDVSLRAHILRAGVNLWLENLTAVSAQRLATIDSLSTGGWHPYVGGAAYIAHHTTHHAGNALDPGAVEDEERWQWGGKAFTGLRFAEWGAAELAYFHFGKVPVSSHFVQTGSEESQAAALSVLLFSDPLLPWRSWAQSYPIRLYARGGGAYKYITEETLSGASEHEAGPAFLLGGGMEIDLSASLFARIEYEYMSWIGTTHVVNAQHTPISLSIGFRF